MWRGIGPASPPVYPNRKRHIYFFFYNMTTVICIFLLLYTGFPQNPFFYIFPDFFLNLVKAKLHIIFFIIFSKLSGSQSGRLCHSIIDANLFRKTCRWYPAKKKLLLAAAHISTKDLQCFFYRFLFQHSLDKGSHSDFILKIFPPGNNGTAVGFIKAGIKAHPFRLFPGIQFLGHYFF